MKWTSSLDISLPWLLSTVSYWRSVFAYWNPSDEFEFALGVCKAVYGIKRFLVLSSYFWKNRFRHQRFLRSFFNNFLTNFCYYKEYLSCFASVMLLVWELNTHTWRIRLVFFFMVSILISHDALVPRMHSRRAPQFPWDRTRWKFKVLYIFSNQDFNTCDNILSNLKWR